MDREHEIYSLNIEDVFMVIEDSDVDVEFEESDIRFIEDEVGEMIDWHFAIETALIKLKDKKAQELTRGSKQKR